jgi:uncharacterized membrane protein YfcA
MDLKWYEIALAGAVVLAAGVVRGFSGFGAGLVMVPALTLLVGPLVAVPTVVLMEALAATQLVPSALRDVRWATVLPLGLAASLTIPIGSTVLASLDVVWTRRAISVIVLVFVVVLGTGWRYRKRPSRSVTVATGAASGLLTGVAGVGGPPVILFYLSGQDDAPGVRAGLICYFAITQLIALAAYAFHGLVGMQVLVGAAVLTPVFVVGTVAGTRLFGRVDDRRFRGMVLVFLTVVAIAGLF